jgi:hypothetical protein
VIVERANLSAGNAAATFRNLLAAPSFAAGLEHLGNQISGSELVHTSYFDHGPILDLIVMHMVWAQNNPNWYQFAEQWDQELGEWFIEFKRQVGAESHFLKLPSAITQPSLQLFVSDEPQEIAPMKLVKQKPRRRSVKEAA